ncbi:hypothetical protein ACWGI8_27985 [Streptomyces sp. NPDC054841]
MDRLAEAVGQLSLPPGTPAVIVTAAGNGLWGALPEIRAHAQQRGATTVVLAASDLAAPLPDGRTPAQVAVEALKLEVLAPDGLVSFGHGGRLIVAPRKAAPEVRSGCPTFGWWALSPGGRSRPLGTILPAPRWRQALRPGAAPSGSVAIPAGLWFAAPDGPWPTAVLQAIPDPECPTVLVGSPAGPAPDPDRLAAFVRALPPLPAPPILAAPWSAPDEAAQFAAGTAALIGTPVRLRFGLTIDSPDGPAVRAVGRDGRLSWESWFTELRALPLPDGAGADIVPYARRVPAQSARIAPALFELGRGWITEVVPSGLWCRPAGTPDDPWARSALLDPDRPTVIVGEAGLPVHAEIWESVARMLNGIHEPLILVRGTLDATSATAARIVTDSAGTLAVDSVSAAPAPASEPATPASPAPSLATSADTEPAAGNNGQVEPRPKPLPARRDTAALLGAFAAPPRVVRTVSALSGDQLNPEKGERPPVELLPQLDRGSGRPPALDAQEPARDEDPSPLLSPADLPVETGPVGSSEESPDAQMTLAELGSTSATTDGEITTEAFDEREQDRLTCLTRPETASGTAGYTLISAEDALGTPAGPDERRRFREALGSLFDNYSGRVEALVAQSPGLRAGDSDDTKTDLVAVLLDSIDTGTLMSRSELATNLRRAGESAEPYAACLLSGLRRLPSYPGAVTCGAQLPTGALALYRPGTVLHEPAPVSALAGTELPLDSSVQYLIWSVTGRRTAVLTGEGEYGEVVFPPGSRFVVLEAVVAGKDGGPARVFLRETRGPRPSGQSLDPTAMAKEMTRNRTAQEKLKQALPEEGPGSPSSVAGDRALRAERFLLPIGLSAGE